MVSLIENKKDSLKLICEKNFVSELYLFGSGLSTKFNHNSDIDFAVIFTPSLTPIQQGEAFLNLLTDLQFLFDREIDLISYRVIKNPIFKKEVDETKITLYAAA